MLNKRLIAILAVVILLAAAAFTVRASIGPAPVAPIQVKAADPAIWYTPPYQGYTPWNPIPADLPGVWHTPPYQGYTPANPVPADPPGVWNTPPYQGYTP
jgi:hypothetical protein